MTTIKAYNVITRDFEYVKQNNTGLLISGGSSGGGDASAANQQLQLTQAINSNVSIFNQLAAQTDRLLYDTDIIANNIANSNLALCSRLDSIDVSASNMEVQLDKLVFSSGNLLVHDSSLLAELQGSNLATNTKLGLIAEASEDILISVNGISAKLNALQIQSAKYTIEAVSQFAPDTEPAYSTVAGIAKDEGWYYKNLLDGQVSQLYFYSYLNPAMSVAGRQFAYQLNDITMSYCVVKLIAVNSAEGLPTLAIYTRPTGSGDAVPGFIRSRRVYNIPTSSKLTQGMEVMLWWGLEPTLKLHPTVARIQLQLVSTIGPALGTEQLAFISLNTDSAALVGNAEYVVSAAGFQYGGELIMDTQFTGESSASVAGGDASAANQVSSNTAICARLDNSYTTLGLINTNLDQLTYSGSNLFVKDSQVSAEIASLNSTIGQGIYVNMDTDPAISGGVKLHGSTDGNLFVYDAQSYSKLLTINTQLDGVIEAGALKVIGDFYQASQPVVFESAQSVNLYTSGVGLTYTQTGASQYSLDVNVNNASVAVTGEFWQATQPVSIEQLSFTAGDELIVYDDYTFQQLQTLNGKVVSCDTGNVVISSGSVSVSGDVGLVAGTSVALTTGSQVQLINSEVSLVSGTQVGISNFPSDYATEATQEAIKTQTDKLSFYEDAYGAFDLRTQVMNEIGVSVNNTPTVGLSGGTEVGLIAGTQVALASGSQVQLLSSEVGLIAGTTVGLSAGAQVQLVSSEVALTAGTTVGLSAGASVDVNNFPSKQSVFVENTAEGLDLNVNVTNASLAITASSTLDTNITNASIPITSASTLDVSVQNSSLDVHAYASSNGSSWHHLASDANGRIITLSRTHDGSGNDITSETFGSGGASRGLHTIIGNTSLAVTGSVTASANQYGSYGNLANSVPTILAGGVTSGINVSAWSYFVGAYEDFNAATVGTISLEYSFDNITYYTLFNTQLFPSGSSPRRTNISKQDIPGVNWIRLRNGTSSTLLSVTATLLGGSLS
jgi:hypothetical protein